MIDQGGTVVFSSLDLKGAPNEFLIFLAFFLGREALRHEYFFLS